MRAVFFLLLALLALVVLPSLTSAVDVPFTLCSKTDKYHYNLTSLTALSWPPSKGASVNVTANGTLDETVTSGTYSAKATYTGFPLPSQSGDISTMKPVPWSAGPFEFDYVFPIPGSAPSGKYTAQLSAADQNKTALFCINLAFSISAEGQKEEGVNLRTRWQEVKRLEVLMK